MALLSTVLAVWAVAGMVEPGAAADARVGASRAGIVAGARLVGAAPRPAATSAVAGLAGAVTGPLGAVIGPAGAVTRPAAVPTQAFGWPLLGWPAVVRPFDPPARPWLPGHRGVDLAGAPSALVLAAGPGTVSYAGRVAGTGVVSIDHANGLRTTYEPVLPLVHAGQVVRAGDPIGILEAGHPGCPVAACLHWGLRRGHEYLDPLSLLGRGRVRLLPLSAADARTQQGR